MEIDKNTGRSHLEETVSIASSMSAYTPDKVRTADGDRYASSADHWLVREGDDQRAATFVVGGPGGDQPDGVTFSGNQVGYSFDLDLAPRETQIVMHFVALDRTVDGAVATAEDTCVAQGRRAAWPQPIGTCGHRELPGR